MWIDWLFPRICQGCGAIGQWLCYHCLSQVEFYPNPVVINLDASKIELALDQVITATYFQPPLSTAIKALKYHGVKDIGSWLGDWLYEIAPIPAVDYLVSIPLYSSKQKLRGYNQAELMAQTLAKKLQIPYLPLLIKTQATSAQAATVDKQQRLHQLTGLFELDTQFKSQTIISQLKDRHALLLDDVVTTGATLNTAATVLKQIGVKKVIGLAVAHGQ